MNSETKKYLCIHGHFYQPPRENPWIDAVELEPSAYPYHDWNVRIARECYGPNAWARLHDGEGQILKLVNNYEYMSFNFGPTLLSWMEQSKPDVYKKIIAADQASRARYGGHGNAMAQVYNHIIMPLANGRDSLTQIRWGLADFEYRFGRQAEGMWLAETAVDRNTLEIMADLGVTFTILSPTQAQAIRSLDGGENSWQDVSGGKVDTTKPYRVFLESSRSKSMDVFFYDGSLSRAVAYEKILNSGQEFLSRIERTFGEKMDQPKLVSIATDGESYGHHFKFGDLALAWLFDHLTANGDIHLTNYAAFLERFPPQNEVKLIENSSWSCAHGIERWRADCGCSVSQTPGWTQAWRAPLREGLNWLSDKFASIFEEQGRRLFKDPWHARDAYVNVLLNPSQEQKDQFLGDHAGHPLGKEDIEEAFQLLESQRMAIFMFTSCGWFFDDISGLESVQVLKYANRAIDLVKTWAAEDLEAGFLDFLVKAQSNDPVYGDGRNVYENRVRPSRLDPPRVAAHYGFCRLVEEFPEEACLFKHLVHPIREKRLSRKDVHAVLGEVMIEELKTERAFKRVYLALQHIGGDFYCLLINTKQDMNFEHLAAEILPAIEGLDKEALKGILGPYLKSYQEFGLNDLIPDARRCLFHALTAMLDLKIQDLFENQNGLTQGIITSFEDTHEKPHGAVHYILPILIRDHLIQYMSADIKEHHDIMERLNTLIEIAEPMPGILKESNIRGKAHGYLRHIMADLANNPDPVQIHDLIGFLDLSDKLNMQLDLWEMQNRFYDFYKDPESSQRLQSNIKETFKQLGQRLGFALE